MRWVWRLAGVGGLVLIFLTGGVVLRWRQIAGHILAYYMGSQVHFQGSALRWCGADRWEADFEKVRVASTAPDIPFPPLEAARVRLTFEGRSLRKVHITGASVYLLRQGTRMEGRGAIRSVRNYQRLFPRRGKGRSLYISIAVEGARFYLYNEPAHIEVQAEVWQAQTELHTDSVWLGLRDLRAELKALGLCYRGRPYDGVGAGRVRFEGKYRKATDSWERAELGLDFQPMSLRYEGEILAWAMLRGVVQVRLDSFLSGRWVELPPLVQQGMGRCVEGSLCFEADMVAFHLWGEGPWGTYQVCGRWQEGRLSQLEGQLRDWPAWHLIARSPEALLWEVWGRGWYAGYPWQARAHLHWPEKTGQLSFQLKDITGNYEGTLKAGQGWLQRGPLRAFYLWEAQSGLHLMLDTVQWPHLREWLEAYHDLLKREDSGRFRWRASLKYLHIEEHWGLQEVELGTHQTGYEMRGRLCYRPWDTCLKVWGQAEEGGQRGRAILRGSDDCLWIGGAWEGDSVEISLSGLIMGEYYVQGSGWGELRQRRLRLRSCRAQSVRGSEVRFSGAISDSLVDGIVWGAVSLPEVLSWFRLRGVEVEEGLLTGEVCFQEGWETLFSWDNRGEGWTQLEGVRGRFRTTDLPLRLEGVRVAFDPQVTCVEGLSAQIGEARLRGTARVQGALGYIYEDWRSLHGKASLYVENFRLTEFWRIKRDTTYVRRLLLPEKMDLEVEVEGQRVDILRFEFDNVKVGGRLSDQVVRIERVEGSYKGGRVWGWGLLDVMDTACYTAAWQARAERLSLEALFEDSGLLEVPAIRALGLRGEFAGEIQAALRFAPNLTWRQNSSLLASGQIACGLFRTPPFFRWLRPFYLAPYRDSMDFLARVSQLSVVDGYLSLSRSLLLTRMAAFTIEGTHLLPRDRFLYRIQATRVYRKAQRYPHLERLSPYLIDRLASSLWLVYVEKEKGQVRWRYPFKYLLKKLLVG